MKKLASNVAIGRAEHPENPPETLTHTVCMQKEEVNDLTNETKRQEKFATLLEKSNQKFDAQTQKIRDCVLKAHDIFALDDNERGETKGVEHVIETGDHQPIRQAARRVPFAYRSEITRMINEMLASGVIQESSSPWASPVVLVHKKDNTLRFCVD